MGLLSCLHRQAENAMQPAAQVAQQTRGERQGAPCRSASCRCRSSVALEWWWAWWCRWWCAASMEVVGGGGEGVGVARWEQPSRVAAAAAAGREDLQQTAARVGWGGGARGGVVGRIQAVSSRGGRPAAPALRDGSQGGLPAASCSTPAAPRPTRLPPAQPAASCAPRHNLHQFGHRPPTLLLLPLPLPLAVLLLHRFPVLLQGLLRPATAAGSCSHCKGSGYSRWGCCSPRGESQEG